MAEKKLITVVGATGAQGGATARALLRDENFAVRAVTDPDIPTNGGCFRPVSLHCPEGTLVNPREPAPVNSRTSTLKRLSSCIVSALQAALPDRIPADSASTNRLA